VSSVARSHVVHPLRPLTASSNEAGFLSIERLDSLSAVLADGPTGSPFTLLRWVKGRVEVFNYDSKLPPGRPGAHTARGRIRAAIPARAKLAPAPVSQSGLDREGASAQSGDRLGRRTTRRRVAYPAPHSRPPERQASGGRAPAFVDSGSHPRMAGHFRWRTIPSVPTPRQLTPRIRLSQSDCSGPNRLKLTAARRLLVPVRQTLCTPRTLSRSAKTETGRMGRCPGRSCRSRPSTARR
jgi:hypothetical protein